MHDEHKVIKSKKRKGKTHEKKVPARSEGVHDEHKVKEKKKGGGQQERKKRYLRDLGVCVTSIKNGRLTSHEPEDINILVSVVIRPPEDTYIA